MRRFSSIAKLIDTLFSESADDQRSKFHDEPNEKNEHVSLHNMIDFFFQEELKNFIVIQWIFAEIKECVWFTKTFLALPSVNA